MKEALPCRADFFSRWLWIFCQIGQEISGVSRREFWRNFFEGGIAVSRRFFFPLAIIIFLLAVDIFLFEEVSLDRNFPAFRAEDFNGAVLTDEIFAGKLTVLCIWSTNYDECAEMLAALEDLNQNLPPNVQIIGFFGEKEIDAARALAIKNSPSIPQILANDDFLPLLSKIKFVPTTIFVDAQGRIIGQPVTGAEIILVQRELARILEMDSPRTKNLQAIQSALFR